MKRFVLLVLIVGFSRLLSQSQTAPIVSSISPAVGAPGTTASITVTGTNLVGVTSVIFSGTGISATIGSGGTTTSLPLTLVIASDAMLGPRSVMVATITGTSLPCDCFTVVSGSWTSTGSMSEARVGHSATLLPNGKVLVAGGRVDPAESPAKNGAELYDPITGTWTGTGSMITPRAFHTATLLSNGKVLVAGGREPTNLGISLAELYDPKTGVWQTTGTMTTGRWGHTTTLLSNGKVLVTGGQFTAQLKSVEIYDPSSGTWQTTGEMSTSRRDHRAVLLLDGNVLVTGGHDGSDFSSSTEVYDALSGIFTPAFPMTAQRGFHTATLLLDGRVLVAGGAGVVTSLASVELYNPATRTWTPANPMAVSRQWPSATLLTNGEVLVAGGRSGGTLTPSSELYHPDTGTFSSTPLLVTGRFAHTATLLPNGQVLVAGGSGGNFEQVSSTELYRFAAPSISGISPSVGAPGTTVAATITRTNIAGATAVTFSGTGVSAVIASGATSSSLPITVTIAADATLGTRTLTITTAAGTSTVFTGFTVTSVPIKSPTAPTGPVLQKWADTSLPILWRMNPATGTNISGSRAPIDVIRLAFGQWSGITTIARIPFIEDSSTTVTDAAFDQVNLVSMLSAQYGSDAQSLTVIYSFNERGVDQFGRTIQFPGQILEADILLNPAVEFSTELVTPPNKLDLQSVLAHEIGHLLGLDHSGLVSAVMAPTLVQGRVRHALTNDDVIRVSMLYPSADSTKGAARGVVRNSTGLPVFGAHVVIVNSTGQPVASTSTDPDGVFEVRGLEPGSYSAYAEVLDGPLTSTDMPSLARIYPGATPAGNFTTRFAVQSSPSAQFTLTKTGGDNQLGNVGQALAIPLEVQLKDSTGSPVAGVSVSFAATGGGGTVVPIRAVTDAQGKARTQVYLGSGALQTFTASMPTATVTFTATLRQ